MVTKKKLDAEPILRKLTEMRKQIPFLEDNRSRRSGDGRVPAIAGKRLQTAEDFEWAALADGVESLADDLREAIDRKRAEAMEMALQVYYTAEELARDPEHADLIPQVERMREAYLKDFGRPIPPNPKTK